MNQKEGRRQCDPNSCRVWLVLQALKNGDPFIRSCTMCYCIIPTSKTINSRTEMERGRKHQASRFSEKHWTSCGIVTVQSNLLVTRNFSVYEWSNYHKIDRKWGERRRWNNLWGGQSLSVGGVTKAMPTSHCVTLVLSKQKGQSKHARPLRHTRTTRNAEKKIGSHYQSMNKRVNAPKNCRDLVISACVLN